MKKYFPYYLLFHSTRARKDVAQPFPGTHSFGLSFIKTFGDYPLYFRKRYKDQLLLCPALHPKYFSQRDCNYLLRLTPTVRHYIDYNSQRFKEIYHQRTSAERALSRLLTLTMLKPTVIGLQAIQNHCTIAHITVLLIALAGHHLGFHDKICFAKTFLTNLN